MKLWQMAGCVFLGIGSVHAQSVDTTSSGAGYVPVISGGMGYVHNVNGGITTLEPQINHILLFPFGSHVLLESRTDFTGFFFHSTATTETYTLPLKAAIHRRTPPYPA